MWLAIQTAALEQEARQEQPEAVMLGKKAESRNQQEKQETTCALAVTSGWLVTSAQSCSVV